MVFFIGYKEIGIICSISIRYFIQSQDFRWIHYKYLLYGHKKSEYFYPCYLFYAAILKIENSRRTHWKRILFMYSISFFLRCINCHGCIHPTPGTSRYIYSSVNIYNIYNKYLYLSAETDGYVSRPLVCCMFSPEAPNLTVWLCMLTGDGSMPLSDRHKMLNA